MPPPPSARQQPEDVAVYEDNWNPSDPDEYERLLRAGLVPRMRYFDDDDQENPAMSPERSDRSDHSDRSDYTDDIFGEDSGNEEASEEADDLDRDLDENGEGADVDPDEDEGEEGEGGEDEGQDDDELPFNPSAVGLKEISNLASFTVSSYKPGCGVKELRDDDINLFWQ